jgi:transcriptional regulator with XRE-family HTH domain
MEPDHKMDKRLKITEIAARTQLSISTVSRVLAGKANTSEKSRAPEYWLVRGSWG